ncbi:MAG: methyltransferase type 12 [Rhodospirillaceae bacterium]|nr:methyltransferase type 12 [Rhodospirillaceae bacterium]|tara:strand:+ start:405 stop:1550 length:1146 start_codon:yes stop_codon:yes gene_type:complete
MDTQIRHPMLVEANHDENVRQQFVHNLRLVLAKDISPLNHKIYEKKIKPAFIKEYKREPENRHEVRKVMTNDPFYRLYSATQRASQEMMWDSVIDSVEREYDNLHEKAAASPKTKKSSCEVTKDFKTPSYHTAADIHLQPGGYHWEKNENDISAGAVYDRSVFIYAIGGLGNLNDDLGRTLTNYFKEKYPNKSPKKILDMGCSVGHSTVPWVETFPEAEVHGIDCGAGMVKYAHARANYLDKPIHFSQQNAEKTNFENNSFDVVCSHIVLHETSTSAFKNILKECHRILKPGGIMLHLDVPNTDGMDPFTAFITDWEAYNNNETFLVKLRDMNWVSETVEAGFGHNKVQLNKSETYLAQKAIKNGDQPSFRTKFPILVAEK